MTAQPHPSFRTPADRCVSLWRYMDLAKFLSLLDDSSLFFARADKLGDPFEGAMPEPNMAHLPEMLSDPVKREKIYPGLADESLRRMIKASSDVRREVTTQMFVSCWHASEYESAAMWSIYSKANESIAVRTTFDNLYNALPGICNLGEVTYIDYNNTFIDPNNLYNPFLHKRRSFEYEREVRAIIWTETSDAHEALDTKNPQYKWSEFGTNIKVNLTSLIQEVFISPTAPPWFTNLVESLVARFGFGFDVRQSALKAEPLF